MSNEKLSSIRSSVFWLAQANMDTAKAQYDGASSRLELAKAAKRLGELGAMSWEAVGDGRLCKKIGAVSEREREIGLAFARYAVLGRSDPEFDFGEGKRAPVTDEHQGILPTTHRDLVMRAVINARVRHGVSRARWACVRDVFGCGSTLAWALCREFGLNPDDTLTAPPDEEGGK